MTIGKFGIFKILTQRFSWALQVLSWQVPVKSSFEQIKAQGYFKSLICCFILHCHGCFEGAAWWSGQGAGLEIGGRGLSPR